MNDGFFKPPGLGISLAFVSGIALLMGVLFGDPAAASGVYVALLCGGIAVGMVMRLVGRRVGYWIGYTATDFATGFNEAHEEARRARGGN